MICSEFSGCHEALRGVLIYNPFSSPEFLETMDKALSMNAQTKEENMAQAYKYLEKKSVSNWTQGFLTDLKHAYSPVDMSYFLGFNFQDHTKKKINRLMKSDIIKLNQEMVTNSFLKGNKCVIFIEIEALPHLQFSKVAIPTNEVIE